jgi:hypothetical protein
MQAAVQQLTQHIEQCLQACAVLEMLKQMHVHAQVPFWFWHTLYAREGLVGTTLLSLARSPFCCGAFFIPIIFTI